MVKTWVCADHHFGHQNILNFKRPDGSPLRDFSSIEEHDQALIDRHNTVVEPKDRVYFLGDLVINRKYLPTVDKLIGRKVLVKGNHDIFKIKDYLKYFDDIRSYVVHKHAETGGKIIMSHIPIHPDSVGRFGINIHGHLHSNKIENDDRYICVSMEHINYTPIEIHTALKMRGV